MASGRVRALLEEAVAALQGGRPGAAQTVLDRALELDPRDFDALNLSGVAMTRIGLPEDAVVRLQRAVQLRPTHAGARNNLGIALRGAGRSEEAVAAYREAIRLEPRYPAAHTNLGTALADLSKYALAVESYDRSLRLRADHVDTLIHRGNALRRMRRFPEAMASLERAGRLAPHNVEAVIALGDCLQSMGRAAEALAARKLAMRLAPERENLLDAILWPKVKVCDWSGSEELLAEVTSRARTGELAVNPFASLLLMDDAEAQLIVARRKSSRYQPAAPLVGTSGKSRIALGYFSADFKDHPMMHLMGEVLAMHDRDRFHVSGYAFNVGKGDSYTERARTLVDEFIVVDGMSDGEVADLARERGLDIAVDRKGYTAGSRTGIFARRPAPVQVNYLAYPGTMGADFIDYIVADKVIVPADSARHYAEKIVWMPDCYAPRDTRVEVPTGRQTRADAGLPEDAFVFSSFNQSSKITPGVFDGWMAVLRRVEGSVLWLLDDNPTAGENLRREAAARGVAPERLIFASKLPQVQHLERLAHIDLCLDTLPYNAHTTANDALYMGVPILTRPGETFAGRVCASLVSAVGMPELIVEGAEAYVEEAVRLGNDMQALAAMKAKLLATRRTARLYDMRRYVTALEQAFVKMHERQQAGLSPDHITVALD